MDRMIFQDKLLLWALAGTVGSFVFFFQWADAEGDAKRLARSLYIVCETLRHAAPSLMERRDIPVTNAESERKEWERYVAIQGRIINHCEDDEYAERFFDIQEEAIKRAAK